MQSSAALPPEPSDRAGPLPARALAAVVLLLIALVPIAPVFFVHRYPGTHESLRYEQLTMLFADAIAHGHLYPRLLPQLAGGYGYPTFVFYQPLVFWVGTFVSWTGLPPATWVYAGNYAFFAIGAAGAYRVARVYCRRGVALAAALIFVLTPYLFVNLHIRGDQSELAASLFVPWILWAMISLKRRVLAGERTLLPAAVGGIAIAATVLAHPIPALLAIPLLGLTFLAQFVSIPRPLRGAWVRSGLAVCAVGLALSLPYWMCVLQFAPLVHMDRTGTGYFSADLHLVPWNQFLSAGWTFGVSAGEGRGFGQMSLPLGLAHALLAVAGLVAGRRNGWIRAASLVYLVLILLMAPLSLPLWKNEHFPLRAIQFPWRAFSVLATFQFMMLVGLLGVTRKAWVAWVVAALVAGIQWQMFRVSPWPIMIVGEDPQNMSWQQASDSIRERVRTMNSNYVTFANVEEFDPMWMSEPPAPRGDGPIISSLEKVTMLPESNPYRIAAKVESSKSSGVLLKQLYFPGWNVEVNGQAIDDETLRANLTRNGTMLIPVEAGTSTVIASYDGPPGGTLRISLMVLTLLIAGGVLWQADRAFRGVTTSPPTPGTAPAPSHSPPAEGA